MLSKKEQIVKLQDKIDSQIWKSQPSMVDIIFEKYTQLSKDNPEMPTDFGSPEFWAAVCGEEEKDASSESEEEAFEEGVDIQDDQRTDEQISKCVVNQMISMPICF